ncbi:MAG: hypothetical protein IPO78_00005, partial [Saprospiraceae bacterium]|nr:hypothetical protein [Saprospiraceae bacterium]
VMGLDYSLIGVTNRGGKTYISQATAKDADKGTPETESSPQLLASNEFYLRVNVKAGAVSNFSYSLNGKDFTVIGEPFKAREGRWIGAKVGFVYTRPGKFNDAGSADIDWFRFQNKGRHISGGLGTSIQQTDLCLDACRLEPRCKQMDQQQRDQIS